jgi:Type-F conjugative transfer system protein (TrbI_Ftype)
MDHSAAIATDLPFDEVAQPASARHQAALPSVETDPPELKRAPLPPKRRFAGFSYGQLALGSLLVLAAIWGMWATSRILVLEDRRVVSVRLAAIVNDFVTAEAKSGTPPEQLAPRTRAFMMALDAVLKKRAASGQVVLVGEAVVASSVPDVTTDVVADLAKLVKMPIATAMPPAMPLLAPTPQPPLPSSGQLPSEASRSPFDVGPAPDRRLDAQTEAGPQQ